MGRAEDVYLQQLSGFESLCELDSQGFPHMKHLTVQKGIQIQYIINSISGCVVFPKLESLVLQNLTTLQKIICPGGGGGQLPFKNLSVIKVERCNELKDLFLSSFARGLSFLKEIEVIDCKNMETIVSQESDCQDHGDIDFTELRVLTLQDLPHLITFYSNLSTNPIIASPGAGTSQEHQHCALGEVPFDEIVDLKDRLTTPNPPLIKKIIFRKLEELKLSRIRVEKIWDANQLGTAAESWFSCFRNLQSLILDGCDKITYLFIFSMVKSLARLTRLEVSDCKSMKEIVFTGTSEEILPGEIILFPNLNIIQLKSLPKLRRFCNVSNLIECPSLAQLCIQDCQDLRTFTGVEANVALFDDKVAFPNLKELKITKMDGLKMIWGDELHPSTFSKLKTLEIENGRALLSVFSSEMVSRALNLERLIISDCVSLIEVFDVKTMMNENKFRRGVQETQLKTLHVSNLQRLKHLWNEDPCGLVSFQNLESVSVRQCPSLTSLFPVSVALCLHQLDELIIDCCTEMEEIVSAKEDIIPPKFVFSKVTFLKLWRSAELKRFYPASHTSEWPILNTLSIYHCDKINLLSPNFQSVRVDDCKNKEEQPFLSFIKIMPNLEEVSIRGMDIEMIYNRASLWLADKVKVIFLRCFHDDSQVFPIELLQTFQKLNRLVISCSSFKQLLLPSELLADEENVKILARISDLTIETLSKMTHIWDGEFDELDRILQNLEYLHVRSCDHLITLAPSEALFPNLSSLVVSGCNQLLQLFTSSRTAKSLANLIDMRISECDLLTQIVASDHRDEATSSIEDTVVFPKLKLLILKSLASLTSFCSAADCNFVFPSLVTITVVECPKMMFFVQGVLSTPMLIDLLVKADDEEEELRRQGDLSSMRQFFIETVISHQRLRLSSGPMLKYIWHDELPAELLSGLRFLEVVECTLVTYVISSSLLRSLNNLEELRVANNKYLEEVFDNVGENVGLRLSKLREFYLVDLPSLMNLCPENLEGVLDFKNLTLVDICNCSSLRYVFTTSMVICLVRIQKIQVKSCAGMEAIIFNKEKDDNIVIFPQLSSLLLESLPCLTSFYSGNGVLDSSLLERITIIDCPKMETFTSTTREETQMGTIGENQEIGIKALFNDKVTFPNLETLKIAKMGGVKMIWGDALHPSSFFKLKTLGIEKGSALLSVFSSGMVSRALNIESLIISECESLIEVFDVKTLMSGNKLRGGVRESQLKTLHISKLQKLKQLWNEDPYGLVSFQNLESVSLNECPSLTSLFPVSVALHLHQLEELKIDLCIGMKEIVSGNVRKEGILEPKFVFSKVTYLMLWRSAELKRFYPGSHTSEWPILKSLSIYHCNKIDIFGRNFQSVRVEEVNQQPFLSFIKIMPNLETVSIAGMDMEMIYNGASLWLADKVKVLYLRCFRDKVFPVELLQRFPNLYKVSVWCSNFKQLFPPELLADEENVKILARIPHLVVESLKDMTHIWDGEFVDQVLQNLECLHVRGCDRLISLAPSNALFPSITNLDVSGCMGLLKLLASSTTAKSLEQLTQMQIRECNSLVEIVASGDHEEGSIEDTIVFPKLKYLVLESLASLTSFSSATNCRWKFPSLNWIIAAECPKMEFFCQGVFLSTPMIAGVFLSRSEIMGERGRWEGDLNSTIRQLHKEKMSSTV